MQSQATQFGFNPFGIPPMMGPFHQQYPFPPNLSPAYLGMMPAAQQGQPHLLKANTSGIGDTAAMDSSQASLIDWCKYLDCCEERTKFGVTFSPLGPILAENGFVSLLQLDSNIFTARDLAELLGIKVGHAVVMYKFQDADVEAIKAGKLVIPTSDGD